MYKIGFACMYRHPGHSESLKELETIERAFNPRSTTLRWLNSVSQDAAREKLNGIIEHNLAAQLRLLEYVETLPPQPASGCRCTRVNIACSARTSLRSSRTAWPSSNITPT